MSYNKQTVQSHTSLIAFMQLLRPKQWIKNGFVFAPLIFSGQFLQTHAIVVTIFTALLFCLASSAVYIVNDFFDIEEDKGHPEKQFTRPLASGRVKRRGALTLLLLLYSILIFIYFYYPKPMHILICYILLNMAYSYKLKHLPIIDIFCIALGFVLRLVAGGIALNIPISLWMFSTTFFLALFLGTIKRRQELLRGHQKIRKSIKSYPIRFINQFAAVTAVLASLFYIFFVMTTRIDLLPTTLLVLYGISRYWVLAYSKNQGESPTETLLSDWRLLLTLILWIILCLILTLLRGTHGL